MADGEAELRAAIAAGDPEAFGAWMAGAEPRLRASLRRYADRVDVESVLQETLLRIWQVAPRVTDTGSKTEALLAVAIRIGRNLAIDEIRRAGGAVAEHEAPEEGVLDEPLDPFFRDLVRRCIEALPEKPRRALWERFRSRGVRSDLELAEGLKMQLNTFLQNVGRARKLVYACLEKAGAEWEKAR